MATTTKARKRKTGKVKFDRMFKTRIKAEFDRPDPVQWLAEATRQSYNATSRVLCHRLPRCNSEGRENGAWLRVKKHLTAEEIKVLEKVPYQP